MKRVVLITGASSGIGMEAAKMFAQKGFRVYGAARRVERMEPLKELGIETLPLDVTDEESMKACVETILELEQRIDVLVNNAGYGFFGAVEDVAMEDARNQLDVNLFGMGRMVQLVLPAMRAQHSGRIINVASLAGRIHMPFGAWYHATKFAVEGWSDALRYEVQPFGIKVSIIEPGGIHTDWGIIAAQHLRETSGQGAYKEEATRMADLLHFAYSRDILTNPKRIARAMLRAGTSRCPKHRYLLGTFSHSGAFLHWLLGTRLYDCVIRRTLRVVSRFVR